MRGVYTRMSPMTRNTISSLLIAAGGVVALEKSDKVSTLQDGETPVAEVFVGALEFQSEEAIAEQAGGKKKRGRLGRLTYTFRTADVLNGNRRIYPSAVVKIAVEDFKARIAKNVVFGRLDHPSMWSDESLIVMLSDACVKIASCEMTTDTTVQVVLDIVDNEHGAQLISILNIGGNPGVSQRAIVRWRDATAEDKAAYLIPDNTYAVVAEAMRLITYDVVSEPGFVDADKATVTEHKHSEGVDQMTLEELKAKFPNLYAQIVAEGRAAALAEVDKKVADALAAQKPTIVEEAVKPLKDQITQLTDARDSASKALEAIKPAMVKLGLVNEKITDAQAATQIAQLESQVTTLTEKLKTASETLANQAKETEALKVEQTIAESLKAVSESYKSHPAHDHILRQVAERRLAKKEDAMEAARASAAFIEAINPSLKPKADGNNPVSTGSQNGIVSSVLESLLKSNPANPGAGSGGGNGEDGKVSAESTAVAAILAGIPSLM